MMAHMVPFRRPRKETKQNFTIIVPQKSPLDSKGDHVVTLMLRHRVMSLLLRDKRGHGNMNNYFLWLQIWAGGWGWGGLRVIHSSYQRVSSGLLLMLNHTHKA